MQSFVVSKGFNTASFSSVRFKELQKKTQGKFKKKMQPTTTDLTFIAGAKVNVECLFTALSLKWYFKILMFLSKSAYQEFAVHFFFFVRRKKVHRICKFPLGLP